MTSDTEPQSPEAAPARAADCAALPPTVPRPGCRTVPGKPAGRNRTAAAVPAAAAGLASTHVRRPWRTPDALRPRFA
jgi:hypothetical protein